METHAYDAWNRLVQVTRQGPGASPQVVVAYRYGGLGDRIGKTVINSGNRNRTEYYCYNSRWQLLEIDDAAGLARQQFVWGTG